MVDFIMSGVPDNIVIEDQRQALADLAARLAERELDWLNQHEQIKDQQARLAEAERDAARYRWLRDENNFGGSEVAVIFDGAWVESDLDAFVDEKMRATGSADVCTCMGVCTPGMADEPLPDNCRAKRSTSTVTGAP
jgi:hypothetical protein